MPLTNSTIFFEESKKRTFLLLFGSLCMMLLGFYCVFLSMSIVEYRDGMVLKDFLHVLLPPPIDFSTWIFMATYFATFSCILHVLKRGLYTSAIIFLAAACMMFLRSGAMLLVPLDPPIGMIELNDPILRITNPDHFVFSKDLFFSGHTASMFFFYFITNNKPLKRIYLMLAVFVIIAISLQRIHYTVDILGGILAAYTAYSLSVYFEKICWNFCHRPVMKKLPALNRIEKIRRQGELEGRHPQA